MKNIVGGTWLLLLSVTVTWGQGIILWDEGVDGPLSNTSANPTLLGGMSEGTNAIVGSVSVEPNGNGWTGTEDYFVFGVPLTSVVAGIFLHVDNRSVAWIGNASFGAELSSVVDPINGDLLPQLSLASIGPGTYGMYISPNDLQPFATTSNYRLEFVVQAIPEPSTVYLLLAAVGVFGLHRWRTTRRIT